MFMRKEGQEGCEYYFYLNDKTYTNKLYVVTLYIFKGGMLIIDFLLDTLFWRKISDGAIT